MKRSIDLPHRLAWPHLLLAMASWAILACGLPAKKLVWVGEKEPADFSLKNTQPEIFEFELPPSETMPFDFAVEVTYFDNQMQGWDALPLYYTLTHPDGHEEDKRFSLKLKDEKGQWRGALKDNMTDRIFEETVNQGQTLAPGKYTLKLFGDSKDLAKPILGIVRVAVKIYSE